MGQDLRKVIQVLFKLNCIRLIASWVYLRCWPTSVYIPAVDSNTKTTTIGHIWVLRKAILTGHLTSITQVQLSSLFDWHRLTCKSCFFNFTESWLLVENLWVCWYYITCFEGATISPGTNSLGQSPPYAHHENASSWTGHGFGGLQWLLLLPFPSW